MKLNELNETEKQLINGGNTFSTSTAINVGGGDSLLSLTYHWQYGDKEVTHTLEAGKNVDINLGGNLSGNNG